MSMIEIFMEEYQKKAKDPEFNTLMIPFVCYRALIIANPVILPLPKEKKKLVLNFCTNLIKEKKFSLEKVNQLLKA